MKFEACEVKDCEVYIGGGSEFKREGTVALAL